MIGLFLIALATGGIKPCVSSFGGDQFTSDQTHLLQSFVSVLYFAMNAGSLLSMFTTPVLRGKVIEVCYNKIQVFSAGTESKIKHHHYPSACAGMFCLPRRAVPDCRIKI